MKIKEELIVYHNEESPIKNQSPNKDEIKLIPISN
jgi:hypothetical protein